MLHRFAIPLLTTLVTVCLPTITWAAANENRYCRWFNFTSTDGEWSSIDQFWFSDDTGNHQSDVRSDKLPDLFKAENNHGEAIWNNAGVRGLYADGKEVNVCGCFDSPEDISQGARRVHVIRKFTVRPLNACLNDKAIERQPGHPTW